MNGSVALNYKHYKNMFYLEIVYTVKAALLEPLHETFDPPNPYEII